METNDKKDRRDDIFSRSVRAGKRTYFFDVKATRADDYYLTITESTKRFNDDGTFYYEKHRLFLYKEDFKKYSECLAEVTKYIIDEKGEAPIRNEVGGQGNGASTTTNTTPAPEVAQNKVVVEANVVSEKTTEETDLVEDAHEKAIAEGTSEDNGVNVDASNGQADSNPEKVDPAPADPAPVDPAPVDSNIETKSE